MLRVILGSVILLNLLVSENKCQSIWSIPEINRIPHAQFARPLRLGTLKYAFEDGEGCQVADVLLSFRVGRTGEPSGVKVEWSSSPDQRFEKAAKSVVKNGVFLPLAYYENLVSDRLYQVVRFSCYDGFMPLPDFGNNFIGSSDSSTGDSLPEWIGELEETDWASPQTLILVPIPGQTRDAELRECDLWLEFERDSVGVASGVNVVHSRDADTTCTRMAMAAVSDWLFNLVDMPFVKTPIKQYVRVSIRAKAESAEEFTGNEWPEMVKPSTPAYPAASQMRGERGTVWVKALIDKAGSVRLATLGRSCGYRTLDSLAVISGYDCVFSPLIRNGSQASCWVSYRVNFDK